MAFGIDDAIGAVANLGSSVVARIWPDATEVEKAKLAQISAEFTAQSQQIIGQIDINKTEAASTSLFVAGWRPFVGWVCGAAFAYQFVVAPIGLWVGFVVGHPIPAPPKLDDTLWQLVFGMLGMGSLRTYEKMKGVAANH